ncbi:MULTISPECIES: GNAT family N-acetyltransferase [Sphingomonadaceae]|uniref:GNAT family N-acetyltransferase n=1 Tax=Novosphingobium rhizosphaerae TaxID=1551649 RepID=UPI00145A9526
MNRIDPAQLKAIWQALQEAPPMRSSFSARAILKRIADEGWLHEFELDDLAYACEPRTRGFRTGFDLKALSEALGYRWVTTYDRPRMRSVGAVGGATLASADAAAFLLDLETLGFAFDPWPLIERIRPAIAEQKRVTNAELTVFWAPKMKDRQSVTLVAEDMWHRGKLLKGKLASGRRYEAWLGPDGAVLRLEVKGPKHRKTGEPVETRCPDCGQTWYRGDPDSSAAHRREHKRRMHALDPQQLAKMIAAQGSEAEPELVTAASPAWKHFEMYERARAFKREERYDFVQWGGPDGDDDPHVHGFLMSDEEGRIQGAISFRWRDPEDRPGFWGLQWVWVSPKHRRSGVLSRRWSVFRARFGDFWVESPVSEEMQAFLAKKGDAKLMEWPEHGSPLGTPA